MWVKLFSNKLIFLAGQTNLGYFGFFAVFVYKLEQLVNENCFRKKIRIVSYNQNIINV